MKFIVNGESYESDRENPTVTDLLGQWGADPAHVAVLVNDEVVPAARRAHTILPEGCRVEILTLAGGG